MVSNPIIQMNVTPSEVTIVSQWTMRKYDKICARNPEILMRSAGYNF